MANSIGAYGQSTNDIGAYESAASGTTLTAEGTPSIASPTSSGVARRNLKTATAAVAMAAVVATGTASIGPKVHLNTTQTLTAATEMNVTSYSQDGTSITFTDPAGAPTGSLNLGVENRNLGGGDDNTAWIAVTVTSNTRTASGTPSLDVLTASATAAHRLPATGTPALTAITASGVASNVDITATGTPSLSALTSSGTAVLAPRVYLSAASPLTITTATEMTVTAYSQDGTSITFNDPEGAPTGSLGLGVTNRQLGGGDANTAWIAVTVNAAGTKTASGTPTLTEITASGVAASSGTKTAQGTTSISSPTSTAIVNVFSGTDGTPTLAVITASGVANASGTKTVTGTPSLTEITASGTAVEISTKAASGTPLLTEITASGVASKITTVTGTPSLSAITVSGTASRAGARATGTPQLPTITTTNTVAHHVIATSATSISAVSASGVASGTGTRTASGTPSLTEITASASVRIPGTRNYGFIVTPPKRYHIVKDRPYIAKS